MMDALSKSREFFLNLDEDQLDYIIEMSKHEDKIYDTTNFYFTASATIMFGNGCNLRDLLACIDMHDDEEGAYSEQEDDECQ